MRKWAEWLLEKLVRTRNGASVVAGMAFLEKLVLRERDPAAVFRSYAGYRHWLFRCLAGKHLARWGGERWHEHPLFLTLATDAQPFVREATAQGVAAILRENPEAGANGVKALLDRSETSIDPLVSLALIAWLGKMDWNRLPIDQREEVHRWIDRLGARGERQAVLYAGRFLLGQVLFRQAPDEVRQWLKEWRRAGLYKDLLRFAEEVLSSQQDEAQSKTDEKSNHISDGISSVWTTASVEIPRRLIDQVIGQDHAVAIIKRAARQRRSVLLIGEPGTGKSLLGAAMAELMEADGLTDLLIEENPQDRNRPLIRTVPAGEGERLIAAERTRQAQALASRRFLYAFALFTTAVVSGFYALTRNDPLYLFAGLTVFAILLAFRNRGWRTTGHSRIRLAHSNKDRTHAPFVDATGMHAGGLLGDVRHDPYQSGGHETPPHELIEVGAIHQANGGVLFIDELSTLSIETQQALLTAVQDKKLMITGRNPNSSGSMVRTDPCPCDFVLVLAGNDHDLEHLHPALRSRIRGYGYEVYMNTCMEDNEENRAKLVRFIAQEVRKDGKIPHFDRSAVEAVIAEARRRAGRPGKLTTLLRELGGLVRIAGDVAVEDKSPYVTAEHVQLALQYARTIEQQKQVKEEVHVTV